MSQENDPFGLVGQVLADKYRVDAVVGEGGFGVVYRGYHLSFRHQVAIKCLKIPPHFTADAQALFVSRFRDEGQHLSRLASAHVAIVRVFDFAIATSPNGATMPYLVLEWLEGRSFDAVLADRGARGPMGEREAMASIRPAVEALSVAHELGIVHRDIKAANLFLVDGPATTVKVLDFGIAKAISEGDAVTQVTPRTATGFAPFSPRSGAPEQFSPKKYGATGPWTDVHALGLLLVEMVSGRPPFDADDYGELFVAATGEARPTPRARGAAVSDGFEALCAKAVARLPHDRFQSARELLVAMDAVATEGAFVSAPPATVPGGPLWMPSAPSFIEARTIASGPMGPTTSPRKRGLGRWIAASMGGVVLLAGLGLGGFFFLRRQAPDTARQDCAKGDAKACDRACESGHAASCAALGKRLYTGDGVAIDQTRGVELSRRACLAPEAKGCGTLAGAYEKGRGGLAKDDKRAAELYQRGCDGGDLGACAALGRAIENGFGGLPKDPKKAVALYQRSCDGGELRGCSSLGYEYETGAGGLAKDPKRGVELYRRACDGGEMHGCQNLGYAYDHGLGGLAKDPKKAVEIYQRACAQGHPGSCGNLGIQYERGTGGLPKDGKKAVELYQRACDGGSTDACNNLGISYERGTGGLPKDMKRAAELFQRACDEAPAGCNSLAVFYEHAEGATRDEKKAVELYVRACDGGSMLACTNLGFQYEHEKGGLARDADKAIELYRRACDGGEMDGCGRLGVAYDQAKGSLTRDPKRAAELYQRACDGGSSAACYHLGVSYQQGKGVTLDPKRAVDLYRRSCDDQVMLGCQNLALAFERGTGGLTADKTRAAELYQRACSGGQQYSCEAMKRLGVAPRR